MSTIKARWERGAFRPLKPVNLPEEAEVDVVIPETPDEEEETPKQKRDREEILEILSHSYNTGTTNAAARHNEHSNDP